MHGFRQRQEELRKRVGRLPKRSLVRRRLERELAGLVIEELQDELAPPLKSVPEYPEDEGQPLQWYQR